MIYDRLHFSKSHSPAFRSWEGSPARTTYLNLVQGVRVGQDAQGPDGVSGLLRRGQRWTWSCWLQRGSRSCQGLPQPPKAWEILTILALIAVKPALISVMLMETLQAPKWKILSPAVGIKCTQQDTEKRQRNRGDPLMSAAWETCPRKRIFLFIFLNNTTVIHVKIHTFYFQLVHLY